VRIAIAVSNLLLKEASRGALQSFDEREEQVHPIARAHQPLLDGLREAQSEAEANPKLQERVDAHPSGFVHPAPASPPTKEQEPPEDDSRSDPRQKNRQRAAVQTDKAGQGMHTMPHAESYLAPGLQFKTLREERDTLRARVEELEARLGVLPGNPVEDATTRQQLQRGLDDVAGALGRPALLVSEHGPAVKARIQQLEGELATLGSACDKMRVQHSETCRGLDDEASELRTEVNRINAELTELKRQQPYMDEEQRELGRRERDGEVAELVKKLEGWDVVGDALREREAVVEAARRTADVWERMFRESHSRLSRARTLMMVGTRDEISKFAENLDHEPSETKT